MEDWLGTKLPADYKLVADTYGPLDFGEYIWIHVPCTRGGRSDYGEWLSKTLLRRLAAANERIRHMTEENRRLQDQLARALGAQRARKTMPGQTGGKR